MFVTDLVNFWKRMSMWWRNNFLNSLLFCSCNNKQECKNENLYFGKSFMSMRKDLVHFAKIADENQYFIIESCIIFQKEKTCKQTPNAKGREKITKATKIWKYHLLVVYILHVWIKFCVSSWQQMLWILYHDKVSKHY